MSREKRETEGDSNTITETVPQKKLKRPTLYKVLLHNDNYTTREFVVAVLKEVFHKSETDAVQIMLHVHYNGIGVAGGYTFVGAETKIRTVGRSGESRGGKEWRSWWWTHYL